MQKIINRLLAALTITLCVGMTNANAAQVVLLDFDTGTDGAIVYSGAMRDQIEALMESHYADFDISATQVVPGAGDYSTVFFNSGDPGGLAEHIDFRNIDKNDTAVVNIDGLGLVSDADIVSASAIIGSHEFGHLLGLRHGDSFGAIGNGRSSTGVPSAASYTPTYPGPATADETTDHIMASPASVGSTVGDVTTPSWLSERSAIKLSYNEQGSIQAEGAGPTPIVLEPLNVPNTIVSGDNMGVEFAVNAFTLLGSVDNPGESDFFSFSGLAGDVFSFEVISNAIDDRLGNFIDPQINVFDSSDVPVDYYATAAFNDDEFESADSLIIDLVLPADDTYKIQVTSTPLDYVGGYELLGYNLKAANEPPVAVDDPDYATFEDTALNEAAPGVLGNDTDADGDPLTAVQDSSTSNGGLTLNADGSFDYTPDPNYCGSDSFTYHANDGTDDSNVALVTITVTCVNDAPVAVNNNYTEFEDTQLAGNVITDDTGVGLDSDVDVGDSLSMFSNTDVSHGTLVVNADASGDFTYDPNDDYCGPDSFTYVITDNPSTTPESLTSNTATVAIKVTCVNDPPTLTSVTPSTQTAAYSDYIGTVTVEVDDVDDTSTTLAATNQPTLSEAGGMGLSNASCVPYEPDSESPAENGSTCTWTYTGQVLDPGDNNWAILFTPSDADGAGTVTGTHTLSIEPEDATIGFDGTNPVGVDVTGPGDNTSVDFTLSVAVMETTPDLPACIGCDPEPFGDINLAYVTMQLKPLVGGGSFDGDCNPTGVTGAGYGQTLFVDCNFGPTEGQSIPVNTYIVEVTVDGIVGDVDRYYTGTAEDVLVVFDPSLGFTTAGGWFYWPDTCDMDGEECDPDPTAYHGDKTNFGWTMKYNKKGNKVKGSMLMIRHTWNGEIYRVKSNALYGMSMGSEGGDYPYGFVSFSGKSNYREPGWVDGIGNHVFILYAEDAGEQGCNQDSADKLWIEVQPTDDLTYLDGVPLNLGPDAADGLEAINCGNIFVPHKSGGNGGGKP